jgi:hypothetical protein
MQVVLYLAGFIVLLFILIAAFSVSSPEVSPTEEAANDIMDEILHAEAPEPPPADLFVKDEDLQPKIQIINTTPSPIVVEVVEPVEPVKEPVKKKRKHYPSKPKNKKS